MTTSPMPSFATQAPKGVFEPGLMPEEHKENLCRELLDEFGVTTIRERRGDHELIHGCPIPNMGHSDQAANPTASLNWQKLTFKCLGCGSSGGLLWFIAVCRNTSSTEARKWLEKTTGTGNTLMELDALMKYFDALYGPKAERAPLPRFSPRILTPWALIHPYLTDDPVWVEKDGRWANVGGRGIPESIVRSQRVGYAEAMQIGIEPPTFSERIVLPHFWQGDLVGYQSRRLGDDGSPKFLSSPDFPKDSTLYNYDPLQPEAVVVEAVMSGLRHLGAMHIEATFGASMPESQMRLLTKHGKVILWMDNDDAGWKATERVGDYLMPHTDVWAVDNPWDADAADLPTDLAMELVGDALPYAVWNRPKTLRQWKG